MRSRHPTLRFACLTLGLVLSTACGSPSEPTPAPAPYAPAQQLNGSWRWISSFDVRAGQINTPATAGFEATLRFTADSARSGGFVYTRTGRESITGRFSIAYEDVPGNDFVVIDRSIDFLTRYAWVAAGQNTLRLDGLWRTASILFTPVPPLNEPIAPL